MLLVCSRKFLVWTRIIIELLNQVDGDDAIVVHDLQSKVGLSHFDILFKDTIRPRPDVSCEYQ